MAQPLAQPAGQADSDSHRFAPVSNAVTGGTSIAGAPSFRKRARNGFSTWCLNWRAVSELKCSAPRRLASSICCP